MSGCDGSLVGPSTSDMALESDEGAMIGVGAGFLVVVVAIALGYRYFASIRSVDKDRIVSGYKCPWHPWQLALVSANLINFAAFHGSVLLALGVYVDARPWEWVGPVVYHVVLLALFVYIETFDPAAKPSPEPLPHPFRCTACNHFFPGGHRKHCYSCHKCVTGFDHHCRYLNQCIGHENYRAWVLFMLMSGTMFAVQLGVTIHALVQVHKPGSTSCGDRAARLLGTELFTALACLAGFIESTGFFFVVDLMIQHFRMAIHNIRTGRFTSSFTWWGNRFRDQQRIDFLKDFGDMWFGSAPRRAFALLDLASRQRALSTAFDARPSAPPSAEGTPVPGSGAHPLSEESTAENGTAGGDLKSPLLRKHRPSSDRKGVITSEATSLRSTYSEDGAAQDTKARRAAAARRVLAEQNAMLTPKQDFDQHLQMVFNLVDTGCAGNISLKQLRQAFEAAGATVRRESYGMLAGARGEDTLVSFWQLRDCVLSESKNSLERDFATLSCGQSHITPTTLTRLCSRLGVASSRAELRSIVSNAAAPGAGLRVSLAAYSRAVDLGSDDAERTTLTMWSEYERGEDPALDCAGCRRVVGALVGSADPYQHL